MYKKNVYVHKECWFEYTQVKRKQTIEVCLYLSIKSICIMYRWKLYVFERSLICTRKKYVHKRMLWDLHREGGPWSIKKFERKRNRFYRLNRIDHGKRCKFDEKFWRNDFESVFEMWSSFMRSFEKNRNSKVWKIHLLKWFWKALKVSFSARLKHNQMKVFSENFCTIIK